MVGCDVGGLDIVDVEMGGFLVSHTAACFFAIPLALPLKEGDIFARDLTILALIAQKVYDTVLKDCRFLY